MLWESRGLPLGSLRSPGPAYMPVVLAALLALLGVLIAVFGARSPAIASLGWRGTGQAATILATVAFAALALERLGYRVTMAAVLFFLVGVVERRGWVLATALAVALAGGSFYLFETLLRVPLPRGWLGL